MKNVSSDFVLNITKHYQNFKCSDPTPTLIVFSGISPGTLLVFPLQ